MCRNLIINFIIAVSISLADAGALKYNLSDHEFGLMYADPFATLAFGCGIDDLLNVGVHGDILLVTMLLV